jgi:hypothetical protein
MKSKLEQRAEIARVMQEGGYFDTASLSGSSLQRVREYFAAFANGHELPRAPHQYPDYPCFPGLLNSPFHDVAEVPGAAILVQNFETIYREWRELTADDYLKYAPGAMHHTWNVHLLYYMGVCFQEITGRFRKTHELLRSLPRVCLDYPWGDALVSVHSGGSHLKPHCSVDNLRIRCHLGLQVPSGCAIRVGSEIRTWHEGQALMFEDSFEHEVWNRGENPRAILILDFWHPDLTDIEIEALTAAFRKSRVRELFLLNRLQMAQDVPAGYVPHLRQRMDQQEHDSALRRYWPNASRDL